MPVAGAILLEIAECLRDNLPEAHRALAIVSYPSECMGKCGDLAFAPLIHQRIGEAFQFLPPGPETHSPLVIAAERFQAQEQMGLATLKYPTVLLRHTPCPAKTVGNNGPNAQFCCGGNFSEDFLPLLLRLVTGSQDRAQEMQCIIAHSAKTHQIDGVSFLPVSEPERVHH